MPLRPPAAAAAPRPAPAPLAGRGTSSFRGFDGNPALARILGAQALRETDHRVADTLTEAAGQARQGDADGKAYFG